MCLHAAVVDLKEAMKFADTFIIHPDRHSTGRNEVLLAAICKDKRPQVHGEALATA